MSLLLALILSASAAPTSTVGFDFVGQPECIALEWTGKSTRLDNHCDHPVMVDQSVAVRGHSDGLIPPGATVEIRELSAFTMGMEGQLYGVVAVVVEPEAQDVTPAEEPEAAVAGVDDTAIEP